MEIKTTNEIIEDSARYIKDEILVLNDNGKKWVVLDNDVKEALALYYHLKNHTEVKNAIQYKGMPCCKICNKSAYKIMCEEFNMLSPKKARKGK